MLMLLLACSPEEITEKEIETIVVAAPNGAWKPMEDCASNHPPIVMAHGYLASGDTFADHAARFAANGYCQDRLISIDWNAISQSDVETPIQIFDDAIDKVLAETGSDKAILFGHSAAGWISSEYLNDPARSAKVSHYIHIGSGSITPPEDVEMLNLYSDGDTISGGGIEIEGVENVNLADEDHFQVATGVNSFEAAFEFIAGQLPETGEFLPSEQPEIWGKALYFGDNLPISDAIIEVYPLDPETGRRLNDKPESQMTVGEEGLWGPLSVQVNQPYELRLLPEDGLEIRHYYSGFNHDDYIVRLRGMPTEGLTATLLATIPLRDDTTNLISFSSRQAMIADRDSLTINGVEFATPERASVEKTLIALFHYDANEDQIDGEDPSLFNSFPYLGASDTYWPSDEESSLQINLNGRNLAIPQIGPGIALAVF